MPTSAPAPTTRLFAGAAHRRLRRAYRHAERPAEGAGRSAGRSRRDVLVSSTRSRLSLADFDRAIALDPSNARAFRERSNAYRSIGRLDQALADANQAVRLDPNDAKAFDNRGNVFNNNGQYDRAIADYDEALRLKPDDAQTLHGPRRRLLFQEGLSVGDQRLRSGDQARSEKIARLSPIAAPPTKSSAATITPSPTRARRSGSIRSMPEYFDNRGLSYAENSDYDRAIADYNEAIRLKPQANFLTDRGDSYNLKGDLDRAIADYDRAVALNPDFSIWPTTIAAPPIARRVISIVPSPITSRRCASIRSSTRPPRISPPCARSATGATPPIPTNCCRASTAAARAAPSRRRSAPIPIWRGSTARSTPPTRRRSPAGNNKAADATAPAAARLHRRAQQVVRQSAI